MRNSGHCLKQIARTVSGVFLLLTLSCGSENKENKGDYIARVGQEYLTHSDVAKAVPAGLSADDSLRFANAYVSAWIDNHLISDIAANQIDISEIDRLTDEYRRELISSQYLRQMFENGSVSIPDDTIASYYEAHKKEFVTDQPMVKGLYLKVPVDAKNLRVIRKLFKTLKPQDIDKLENEVATTAIHYDYFADRWMDWDQLETRIPGDFGQNPSAWPAKGKSLDFEKDGFHYLLQIFEVLPSGQPMPLEKAKDQIQNRLLKVNRQQYQNQLKSELLSRAKAEGVVEIHCDK